MNIYGYGKKKKKKKSENNAIPRADKRDMNLSEARGFLLHRVEVWCSFIAQESQFCLFLLSALMNK